MTLTPSAVLLMALDEVQVVDAAALEAAGAAHVADLAAVVVATVDDVRLCARLGQAGESHGGAQLLVLDEWRCSPSGLLVGGALPDVLAGLLAGLRFVAALLDRGGLRPCGRGPRTSARAGEARWASRPAGTDLGVAVRDTPGGQEWTLT